MMNSGGFFLACDADLMECINVYKSSSAQTVTVLLNPTVQPVLGPSFGRIPHSPPDDSTPHLAHTRMKDSNS
jgi:hypothetical protein